MDWPCSPDARKPMAIATPKPNCAQLASADGAERFTDALACWTTHLLHAPAEEMGEADHHLHALTRLLWMDIANQSTVRCSSLAD